MKRECVNARRYGINSLSYFAPRVWYMVPLEIRNVSFFQKFKTDIQEWALENCPCYLCRSETQSIGFIE